MLCPEERFSCLYVCSHFSSLFHQAIFFLLINCICFRTGFFCASHYSLLYLIILQILHHEQLRMCPGRVMTHALYSKPKGSQERPLRFPSRTTTNIYVRKPLCFRRKIAIKKNYADFAIRIKKDTNKMDQVRSTFDNVKANSNNRLDSFEARMATLEAYILMAFKDGGRRLKSNIAPCLTLSRKMAQQMQP